MAYLRIIRPVNCLITLISIFVGAWIGKALFTSVHLIIAALIGFLVCAFGNIVNDIKDIEIDKINNPQRPIPSGRVKKNVAWLVAIVFFIVAAVGAMFLGVYPFLVVITALILLYLYSVYLKKTLTGNLTVALITGLSFIFGGVVGRNLACVVPFVFSIFIHLPREIVKDVIDMKGDGITGAMTLPIVAGITRAYNISAVLLAILCLLLPLPFILGILGIGYITIILLVAYPILLYTIWRLSRNPSADELPRISNLIKVSMGVGLVAMIVS